MCNHFSEVNNYLSQSQVIEQGKAERLQLTRRQLIKRASVVGLGIGLAELLTGDRYANAFELFGRPSINDQKKAGQEAEKDVLQQYKLADDSRVSEIKAVGAKLVANLPEPDKSRWDYDFHLINSKDINAFALPGGPLFFFTGLYDNMTTEDELAAVVGHEMTHVRLQHWAKAYQKQEQNSILLGVAESLGHVGNLGQQVIGFANDTWNLSYSREEEAQADHGGLQDMVASGYNPNGMIDMFNVLLKKVGNGGNSTSVYLSNHPLTTDRIKAAKDQITQLGTAMTFPPERPIGDAAGITNTAPSTAHTSPSPPVSQPVNPSHTTPATNTNPPINTAQPSHPATDM